MKVQRCRYCKGSKFIVNKTNKTGQLITQDPCIYCNARGFTIIKDKEEKDEIK